MDQLLSTITEIPISLIPFIVVAYILFVLIKRDQGRDSE